MNLRKKIIEHCERKLEASMARRVKEENELMFETNFSQAINKVT